MANLQVGSTWRHHSGRIYEVIMLTNTSVKDPDPKYPARVVYKNVSNGTLWSRDASDWDRSFTAVFPALPRPQALIRAVELLRLVPKFVAENELELYDITHESELYDGEDFASDCTDAADALEAYDHNQMSLDL